MPSHFHRISLTSCWIKLNSLYHFPIADPANGDLSTAQLASRTGLTAGTLRMWETRHGFPAPPRLPGRHRRYTERDVEAVREVLRPAERRVSRYRAAIDRVRRRNAPGARSLFAELRRRHPEIQPRRALPKRLLLQLTRGDRGRVLRRRARAAVRLLPARRVLPAAETRWRELARSADLAVAMADFDRVSGAATPAAAEVPIEAASRCRASGR